MRRENRPAVEVQQGMVIYLPSPGGNLVPALVTRVRYAGTVKAPEVCIDGLVAWPNGTDDMEVHCPAGYPLPVMVR